MLRGVLDRETRELWRDYKHVLKEGNPLGLSFVEYVAARVNARHPVASQVTSTSETHWYMSPCGHSHPWGGSCSDWAETT
jgi:hypothetical protein